MVVKVKESFEKTVEFQFSFPSFPTRKVSNLRSCFCADFSDIKSNDFSAGLLRIRDNQRSPVPKKCGLELVFSKSALIFFLCEKCGRNLINGKAALGERHPLLIQRKSALKQGCLLLMFPALEKRVFRSEQC